MSSSSVDSKRQKKSFSRFSEEFETQEETRNIRRQNFVKEISSVLNI